MEDVRRAQVQFLERKGLTSKEILYALSQASSIASSSSTSTVATSVSTAQGSAFAYGEYVLSAVFIAGVGALAYFLSHKLFPDPKPVGWQEEKLSEETSLVDELQIETTSEACAETGFIDTEAKAGEESVFGKLQRLAETMEKQVQILQKLIETRGADSTLSFSKDTGEQEASAKAASSHLLSGIQPNGIAGDSTTSQLTPSPHTTEMSAPLPRWKPQSAVNALIADLRSGSSKSPLETGAELDASVTSGSTTVSPAHEVAVTSPHQIQHTTERAILRALRDMVASNPLDKAQAAASMLCMYLTNLINNAGVPRYRRVSSSNQSFRKCMGELHGHAAVLEALGFSKNGTYYEWGWYVDRENPELWLIRQELMKNSVALLEALKRGEVLPEPLDESVVAGGADMAAQPVSISEKFDPSIETSSYHAMASVELPQMSDEHPGASPTHDATFAQVMEMLGRGEMPADLVHVEDKLSEDRLSIPHTPQAAPTKPWLAE